MPTSSGREHERRRVVGGHVDQDRDRQRVLRQQRQRVGRGGAPPAARRRPAACPACLPSDSSRTARAVRPPGVEHEAAGVDGGGQAQLAGAVLAALAPPPLAQFFAMMPASARPIWPKPSSTTSRCVGARGGAAADLRELERGVDRALGRRRVLGGDDERDVQLRRPLRDRDDVDARLGQGREHARGDAGVSGHAQADHRDRGQAAGTSTPSISLRAISSRNSSSRRARARLPALLRAPKSRSTAPTTTARSATR